MKKIFTIILLMFFCLFVDAQDFQPEKYALTTSATSVGIGPARILDPYLSPFEYSGTQLRINSIQRRFLKPENIHLSYASSGYLDLGLAKHPSGNNAMLFFNINYMFGLNYHFRPSKNLMILTGGGWDIDLGGKYLGRNVNNPFSLDLYTNLNATAELQYKFAIKNQHFRLQYGLQAPLIGYMFVPSVGISYYELFSLNNSEGSFHFSSLHNRQALTQYLNLDIPLKISVLRFGIRYDYLKYSANNAVFHKQGLVFSIGCVMDIYSFTGKKKAPSNFINSYE